MTENESIKKHIEECEHRIEKILGFMESNEDANVDGCEGNIEVLKTVVIALEEIQQYRAIGTVEKVSKLKELYDKAKWLLDDERKRRRSYEAIGTIEEFKDLKEKSVAKKVDENECCPICYTYGKDDNGVAGEYCPNCGQKLGWEGEQI